MIATLVGENLFCACTGRRGATTAIGAADASDGHVVKRCNRWTGESTRAYSYDGGTCGNAGTGVVILHLHVSFVPVGIYMALSLMVNSSV